MKSRISGAFLNHVLMFSAFVLVVSAVSTVAFTPTVAAPLPSPCSIMATVNAAQTIAVGKRLTVGKITSVITHFAGVQVCKQRVGTIIVTVSIGSGTGGYGGITDIHESHPAGLGPIAKLIVARELGPHGGPYDLIYFKKGVVWTSVWANGAAPSALTTLALKIYRLLPRSPSRPPVTTTTSPTATLTWQPIGPADFADFLQTTSGSSAPSSSLNAAGKIGALAVNWSNPQVMYVGAAGGYNRGPLSESGVYKTTDGGSTWSPVDTGLTNTQINDLWMNQSNPNTLLAATEGGIFRTTDGGAHWILVGSDASIGFATMGSTIFAGTSNGVVATTNDGASWTSVESMPYPVTALSVSRATLYIADEDTLWSWTSTGSWVEVYQAPTNSSGEPTDWISWVATDPSNPSTVYVLHCPRPPGQQFCARVVSKSTDGGVNWSTLTVPTTYVPRQFNAQAIALDSVNSQTVYVGGGAVLSTSQDGGSSFTQVNVNPDVWFLLAWPGRAGTYFAGTDQGLYLLSNGGATWKSLNGNLTTSLLYNVTVQGSTIFAAAQDYSPFSSFDGGATWSMQATANSAKGEEGEDFIDPVAPNTVFAMGICCGLQASFDGGQNFAPIASVPPSAYNQSPQGVVVSSTGTVYVAAANGVFSSLDGGHTFKPTGWPMTDPSMVALSPGGGETIFVGTRDTPGNAGAASTGDLYYSVDGGSTWQQSNLGSATGYPTTVATDPNNANDVVVGMSTGPQLGGGILRSSDGGKTFAFDNGVIPSIQQYLADVQYPAIWQISYLPGSSICVAATSNGLFAQTSPISPWRSISSNAIPHMFTGIASSAKYLYVSTMGEGILRLPIASLLAWLEPSQ